MLRRLRAACALSVAGMACGADSDVEASVPQVGPDELFETDVDVDRADDSVRGVACTPTPGELVTYGVRVLEWTVGLPPFELEVLACDRADPECRRPSARQQMQRTMSPLTPSEISELGPPSELVEIELPSGFDGVLEFRAPGLDATTLWLPRPVCHDEQAPLPVWLLKPLVGSPGSLSGNDMRSNRLLLQRGDCRGVVSPFPVEGSASLIRVSPAGADGQRTFTNIPGLSAQSQEAPFLPLTNTERYALPFDETAWSRMAENLTAFYELPMDQDLAIEVFDYIDRYEVLHLRISGRQTAMASAFLSGCEELIDDPR